MPEPIDADEMRALATARDGVARLAKFLIDKFPSEHHAEDKSWCDTAIRILGSGPTPTDYTDLQKVFSRYMKDAWGTPEGQSCILHAMLIMGRFKRHEKMLESYVGSTGDAPVLAACKLLEKQLGINPLICIPVTEGVKHE